MALNWKVYVFAIAAISLGTLDSFTVSVAPFIARQAGLALDSIGLYGLAVLLPFCLQFIYIPLLEANVRRKRWWFISCWLSGAFMAATVLSPLPRAATRFMLFAACGQALYSIALAFFGGFLSRSVSEKESDSAATLYNVASSCASGCTSTLFILVAQRTSAAWVAPLLAILVFLPALSVSRIPEPKVEPVALRVHVRSLWREFVQTLRSRDGRVGLLLCILPAASPSLNFFLPALASDFHASPALTAAANGGAGWLVTMFGTLVGGMLCARIDRAKVYILAALVMALSAAFWLFSPLNQTSYAVGVFFYTLAQGAADTASMAVVFRAIGGAQRSAALQFSMYMSANGLSQLYMVAIDRKLYSLWQLRGLFAAETVFGLLGTLLLVVILRRVYPRGVDDEATA